MTPERLEQIRKVIGDEPLPDWASKIFDVELLAEVDRLRAAADQLKLAICDENNAAMLLRDMSHYNEGVEASECCRFVLDRGRELGLWE